VFLNTDDTPYPFIPLWQGRAPGFEPSFCQPLPSIAPVFPELAMDHHGPAIHDRAAIVICPGGGYGGKADYEAWPVAKWLNSLGVAAFVLDYRVSPYRHPYPLLDARRAIQLVRDRADQWNIDPHRVGILGFSAGGHLASTAGTHFEAYPQAPEDEISAQSFRPDVMVLCYPVISFGPYRHDGSMQSLLGPDSSQEKRDFLSNETQVTAETSPAFIWHTVNDETVPVENSLLFASALSANCVPFELHLFPNGRHGLAMAEADPQVGQWTALCEKWLKGRGF